jgi:hypothetical protein
MRETLVTALVACAHNLPSRLRTRRFLTGLSSDELQFIAEYLGSCILEDRRLLPQMAISVGGAGRAQDRDHKMILVREFLGRTGIKPAAVTPRWN